MPPTGSSWIAVVRWRPRPSYLPHGGRPLAVELIEGHGAGGEREPGRDARMPPGSRTGFRDGRAAGRVPAVPGAIRGREADASPGSSGRPGFGQAAGRP
jgi:hypothetical protein